MVEWFNARDAEAAQAARTDDVEIVPLRAEIEVASLTGGRERLRPLGPTTTRAGRSFGLTLKRFMMRATGWWRLGSCRHVRAERVPRSGRGSRCSSSSRGGQVSKGPNLRRRGRRPSKPPGCRSRPCRRRTSRSCAGIHADPGGLTAGASDTVAHDAEFDFTAVYPDKPIMRGVEELRRFRDSGPWSGSPIQFEPERFFDVDDERVLVFVRCPPRGDERCASRDPRRARSHDPRPLWCASRCREPPSGPRSRDSLRRRSIRPEALEPDRRLDDALHQLVAVRLQLGEAEVGEIGALRCFVKACRRLQGRR